MGKIKIFYYGFVTELVGKTFEELDVSEEKTYTLKSILNPILLPHLGRIFFLVNDRPAELEHPIRVGDEVKVLPHIGGG
ncbi:MAG: MoaD/ThiS family protein [Infirmifilum sp.]